MNATVPISQPVVSVVIPTYNRANYICETIDSVLAQDYPAKEIIVVDDGSSDNTAAVLQQYGNRIQYVHHPNQGEAISVNRGWNMASGKYVSIVSSDDPVLPGWLSACVSFMEKNPAVLVGYPDWIMIDDDGNELQEIKVFDYSIDKLLGWWHCVPGSGTLIRREAFADITNLRDQGCRYVSDMETWTRLALRGDFSRIPGFWATWRYHGGAATVAASVSARSTELVNIAERFFARNDLPEHVSALRAMGLSRAYAVASRIIFAAAPAQSLAYYRRSLSLYPDEPAGLPAHLQRRGFIRDALGGMLRRLTRILRSKIFKLTRYSGYSGQENEQHKSRKV